MAGSLAVSLFTLFANRILYFFKFFANAKTSYLEQTLDPYLVLISLFMLTLSCRAAYWLINFSIGLVKG